MDAIFTCYHIWCGQSVLLPRIKALPLTTAVYRPYTVNITVDMFPDQTCDESDCNVLVLPFHYSQNQLEFRGHVTFFLDDIASQWGTLHYWLCDNNNRVLIHRTLKFFVKDPPPWSSNEGIQLKNGLRINTSDKDTNKIIFRRHVFHVPPGHLLLTISGPWVWSSD